MARTKNQHKGDTAQAHGKPFLKLAFSFGLVLVLFVAMGAGAQKLLKGNVLKQIDSKPNTDLVDRYGDAANDPAVADALRKAQGNNLTGDEIKAKIEADEALQNGVWKPGADPTMALMYGFVPPNMSPEQAAIMAKHLPKMARMPRPLSPEEMAGEPNPDLQMAGMPEPLSPYIPIPDSLAAAGRQPNTRQLPLIPQFPMSPEQLVGGPGMAPMMMGASVMPYGANKRAIEEANHRQIEDYLRDRLGPGYVSPFQKNHNPRPQQVVAKTENGKHVAESDHQSVVGVCDASGNEITSIQYDPWGRHTVLSGGSVMPAFMYKGMYWHDRSQKYLALHRVYDPALARWLTRDPLGEAAGVNLYRYALNNPISYSDPLGLWVNATYSQSKHTFTGIDSDTGATFNSSDIFSGNGPAFQNNPMAEGVGGHGPIPQGEYFINSKEPISDAVQGYQYPLNPISTGTPDFFGMPGAHRGGFTIHPGSRSNGCVTFNSKVKEDEPGYPSNSAFDALSNMLDSTKPLNVNGISVPGILKVVP